MNHKQKERKKNSIMRTLCIFSGKEILGIFSHLNVLREHLEILNLYAISCSSQVIDCLRDGNKCNSYIRQRFNK